MKTNKITKLILSITCLLVVFPLLSEANGKHLFILSGQSNMRQPLPDAFRRCVEAVFGEKEVLVVTMAHPSQPIKQWYKDWQPPKGMVDEKPETNGQLYDRLLASVRRHVKDAPLASVTYVWMQGEADAQAGWGSVYEASFFGVLDQFKADLGIDEINFVVGRINDFWLDPVQFPDGKRIREIQVKLGEENANGAWVDTDDLNRGVNPWGGYSLSDGHFPPPAYRLVGKRFAKAACKLIDPAIRMDDAVFAEAFFDKAEDIESHAALGKPMRASVPPARGDLQSLTDGTFGSQDLKDKAWVGFAPTEELIEIVLDLGAVMQVELAGVNVLFSPASKAEFPGNLTISTSEDGNDYAVNGSRYNHIKLDKYGREPLLEAKASATPLLVITEQKHRKAPDGIQARYVKISFETGTNWVYFDEFVVNPSRTQTDQSMAADKPIKVFLLAGDDHVLENGLIGSDDDDPGKAGTLTQVVSANPKYAFLKDGRKWAFREDVWRYDAHPIQNNTEAPATPVTVGTGIRGSGPEKAPAIGVDLMLSHRLGAALDEPVLLIRYGLRHRTWFKFGSRDLAHDYRPPSSGGGSDLEGSWDVIHFNFGVWDAVYREANSRFYKGRHITAVEDFEKNLRTLVGKMQATGATLIWGSVTPVWEGEPGLPNADEDAYNRVAEKVMREHGVIISDLNAESRRLGFPKTDNVHSVGSLAPKVTEEIRKALAARRHPTKPLPRVLFIGDSITGSYWPSAKRELDGEAVVFKNPGNAEDTWNGLERMDEWLDLGGYLLNGQEYLELVDGVRKVLGDELERALPGYAGQGVELAGIFWMQGDEDSRWPSKAAAYETHLANLIRDLRKDFGKPGLPVVVTALGDSKRGLNPNPQQVFDAQMAVGDGQEYPAFAGNVLSVDTRPMCRPQEASPGGRDRFAGNAASYLEIGDAMAQAMLKLLGRKD